jgi:hypothetical protein
MHATTTDLSGIIRPTTQGEQLAVYVVATTFSGTRAALGAARNFAAGFDIRITLLVPQVVPYPQSVDHPADSVAFTRERFCRLVEPLATDVLVRVCLCRSHSVALAPLLPRDAVVLVGGRCRRWWPTREQNVADALSRTGRQVLFVRDGGIISSCTSSTSFAAPTARSTRATLAILAHARRHITAAAALATRLAAGLSCWFIGRRANRGARRSAGSTS